MRSGVAVKFTSAMVESMRACAESRGSAVVTASAGFTVYGRNASSCSMRPRSKVKDRRMWESKL
ncbi:hypothetical protein D3C83_65120 [compost metagenome]